MSAIKSVNKDKTRIMKVKTDSSETVKLAAGSIEEIDVAEKEMWTAGYKYSWRKMEAAAQDRAGSVVCGRCSFGSDKA